MPETELKKALEFTCSEVQPCVKKVEYTLSSESVKKEMDCILRDYAAHVELPGFRKGKAPAGMVKNRFQPQIEEEFLRRFFSMAFEKFSDNDEMDVVSFSMPDKSKPVINPGEDQSWANGPLLSGT